jgi:hypothetical protein
MKTRTGHRIGCTYHSNYWRRDYLVLSISEAFNGQGVQVRWLDNNETCDHLTPVGEDKMVEQGACSLWHYPP